MDAGRAPTRAAVLELRAERGVVEEAYDFLDEKRLLLAAELLRQLERYEALSRDVADKTVAARERLLAAVYRHGLQGLGVFPPVSLDTVRIEARQRNLMGVTLLETAAVMTGAASKPAWEATCPSAEAEACRDAFRELFGLAAEQAGLAGNLYRLLAAYKAAERRARALENVILPEIEQLLNSMETSLEEVDMEDAIRARSVQRSSRNPA
jgi:V/A-type H+-transporting ATPase subunit D